jgi:hypothetical protein
MTRGRKGLVVIGSGVVFAVSGMYGLFGEVSFFVAGAGLLTCVVGMGILLSSQSLRTLRTPHPYVFVLLGLAAALHLYENLSGSSQSFSFGLFVWAIAPYVLVLALSCFEATRSSSVAGAAVALLMDLLAFHSVFINPTSSTASLVLIFMPLWNILIFVPGATWIAWIVNGRRTIQAP